MRVKQADGSIVSIPLGSGTDGGYYIPSITENDNNTITISFTPSSDDMPAVDSVTFNAGDTQTLEEMLQGFARDPGSVKAYVDSVAGEAGGYYIPSVIDNKDGTISISFTPSESGMTQIAPFWLALPKGEKGDPGVTPIFETDEIVTLEPGEPAYVTIHNDDPENPIMDFGIPRGEKGDKGDSGVYVGSGEMPDGYNVQIDPDGEVIEVINGKSAYAYAKDGGYTGTEAEFSADLAAIPAKVDKSYIVSVFGELKTALENADIDGAIAVLDQAILDMATLA
jgi:hypothetical protein